MILPATARAVRRAVVMNPIQRWTVIAAKDHRINEQIRAKEVRVIGKDREHIGIMSVPEALRLAREAELDLVEISPQAEPPVVQIMDFGKFLYEQHKKEREAKKAQKVIEVKKSSCAPRLTRTIAGSRCAMRASGWKMA
jgi:translation initiation factor IF-3